MEAGNKTSEEKTLEEKSPRGGQEDRGERRGTRESNRARARQGEDAMERSKVKKRTTRERAKKRTEMIWRKRGEWEEREQRSSHALCKGNGLK